MGSTMILCCLWSISSVCVNLVLYFFELLEELKQPQFAERNIEGLDTIL